MISFETNDLKKIGFGLTAFGTFFSLLGVILLFDKGFLAMGNILFVSGVILTIGWKTALQFFSNTRNYKGTVSFGTGFFMVLIGWPMLGMAVEAYGVILLFRGFWPTLLVFLQRLPYVGWVFEQPAVISVFSRHRGRRPPV